MGRVRAPRSVFIDFPLGRNCGRPFESDLQTRILKDTLSRLAAASTPGEVFDLPYAWKTPFSWETFQRDVQDMVDEEGIGAQEWKPTA